jgi:Bacterial regulatory proteins, gntR family
MIVPDRETGSEIAWLTDGLISNGGHVLPVGLMAALREYKTALLAESANEQWARPGHATRYGLLADRIGQEIASEKWKPGERMPSRDYLAEAYGEKDDTVARALHVLAVRGQLALEQRSYYVLPRGMV